VDLKAKRILIEQLARMMKHLASLTAVIGAVRKLDTDSYPHTQLSEALKKSTYRDNVIFLLVARQSGETHHILQQLLPALEKRHSEVLINDYVVPDKGAPYILASLDWEPMNYLAAAERTKSQ
jgi:hypothetical protein